MGSRFMTARLTAIRAVKLSRLRKAPASPAAWAPCSPICPATATIPMTPDMSSSPTAPLIRSPRLIHTVRT